MSGYRPGDAVGVLDDDDVVYVASLPAGPITVLEGIGALIWVEACRGDRETLVDRVAEVTGAAADAIRTDVVAFVADLVARGLLS